MVRDHDNKDDVAEADEAHDTAGSESVAGAQTAGGNLGRDVLDTFGGGGLTPKPFSDQQGHESFLTPDDKPDANA